MKFQRQTHCNNGHELNEANTYVRPDGRGRYCRVCRDDRRVKNYQDNKLKEKQQQKAWREVNSEFNKQRMKVWVTNNPERVRQYVRNRRALKRCSPGEATYDQVQARITYFGSRCAYCGGPYEHIDHVIPLSKGGSNWPANLRPSCGWCNISKKDKLLKEWIT